MATDLLICAIGHSPGEWEKGYVNSYNEYPPGKTWKGVDRRPGWILITVTDGTLANLKAYFETWKKKHKAEISNALSVKNEISIVVDPVSISTKGVGKELYSGTLKALEGAFGASLVSNVSDTLKTDIDKKHSLEAIQNHLADVCDRTHHTRQMSVSSSFVDSVLLEPLGQYEMTLSQFTSNCFSLLDD